MKSNQTIAMPDASGRCCSKSCLSWTGVLAGALIAVGLGFLFFLLHLALGFSAYSDTTAGQEAFSAAGFVAITITTILGMFVAGWIAGFIGSACCTKKYKGELHGFLTWSVALIITILLAGYMGQFLTNYNYVVSRTQAPMNFNMSEAKSIPQHVEAKIESKLSAHKTPVEKKADVLAMTAFATFFLFFIGALSCCFGGRCGQCCRKSCATSCAPKM
jgi:hypothetical protein